MGKIHVISDTHFQHENIIKFCNRPFKNVADQTNRMIENWNSVVGKEDTVIHCGDFILGKADEVPNIINQLNGHIILTRGNHDTAAKLNLYDEHFSDKIQVQNLHYLQYYGMWFIFCHFPVVSEDFARMITGANRKDEIVFVHGHVHDSIEFFNPEFNSFNVSAEMVCYTPILLKSLSETIRRKHQTESAKAFAKRMIEDSQFGG